jgi:hypothetical protein
MTRRAGRAVTAFRASIARLQPARTAAKAVVIRQGRVLLQRADRDGRTAASCVGGGQTPGEPLVTPPGRLRLTLRAAGPVRRRRKRR